MADYEGAVNYFLTSEPSVIAVAIIEGRDIIYSTDNWDVTPDVGRVNSAWSSMNAQFVMISGVKYSMLQCTSERIVATSIRGEGSIVGAKDDERKIIAYVEPDGPMNAAYMQCARALSMLSSKGAYKDASAQFGSQTQTTGAATSTGGAAANVDPQLKSEIQSFIEWIKDTDGLSGYINYYLQQNNAQIISELSKIYSELRSIFGV
jgi:hypothetical protein